MARDVPGQHRHGPLLFASKISGQTDTMPLRVEKLMMEYDTPAAFAVASLLTLLAAVTLLLKAVVERKVHQQLRGENAA